MNPDISAALQAHKDQPHTTTCNLLKIVARTGEVLSVTNLPVDYAYDDGGGEVVYASAIGADISDRSAGDQGEVDSAEASMILVDSGDFTDEKINAGLWDYARFWVYEVNYMDPTMGHRVVHYGRTGAMRLAEGLAGVVELRGLQQSLKQSLVEVHSLICRATFGSAGKFGCFVNTDGLWDAGTIASVDSEEPDRIFTATTAPTATGPNGSLDDAFVPGLIRFTSGDNAGLTAEIEEVDGTTIKLRFPTPYNLANGVTYDARPDCGKRFVEDCIERYDNGPNFRGEPYIPLGDEGSSQTPGASLGRPPSPVLLPDPDPINPDPEPEPDVDPPDPPTPPPSSELVNPGFEDGTEGWTTGVGWSVTGTNPRSGSKSAQLYSANVPSPIMQSERFAVSPPVTINASCYVESGAPASVGARIRITWYDADGAYLNQAYGNTVNAGSWSQSTISAGAPAGAAFASLGAESVTSTFGNPLWVDDFTWNL